ncbi:MAG: hypothetical protein GY757_37940 [bacterium]|nr:hypothetical protein [bacterium]
MGIWWFGTEKNGLVKLDEKSGITAIYKHKPGILHSIAGNNVNQVYQDRSGMLWLALEEKGLAMFDPETEIFTFYPPEVGKKRRLSHFNINTIYEDRSGILWVGTMHGLNMFERENQRFTPFYVEHGNRDSISNNVILTIYENSSGIVWFGTMGGGIDTFQESRTKFSHYRHISGEPNCLSSNLVSSFCEDRTGALWIGTYIAGLDRFDRKIGKFTHFSRDGNPGSLMSSEITAIFEDSRGVLWVGTPPGLNRFNPRTETFTCYKAHSKKKILSNVTGIYEDKNGMLWVGDSNGVRVFDPTKSTFTLYFQPPGEPGSKTFYHLYGTKSGILWLSSTGWGLFKFDIRNKTYTQYSCTGKPGSISSNLVSTVCESRDGTLWIGTHRGFNKFHKESESFTYYTTKEGLPDNVICGILEDKKGFLWISTNKGISRFDPGKGNFKNFELEDGLQGYEFNGRAYYKSKSGKMFFGGTNGFNAFFPGKIKDNKYISRDVFTDLRIANRNVGPGGNSPLQKHISYTDTIVLSYKDKIFSLEFAALDYTNPRENQFMYKVDGLNDGWIHLRNKHDLDFIGLDPGEYTLRIKGSNNDGLWNEKETSIKLIITPPFWQTTWFKILCVLLLGALVYAWHRKGMENLAIKLKTEAELERIFSKYNISKREQEIFYLILKGKSNKNIEDELFISIKTVKNHIYNIYKKLGVQSRIELINLVYESAKTSKK